MHLGGKCVGGVVWKVHPFKIQIGFFFYLFIAKVCSLCLVTISPASAVDGTSYQLYLAG